MNWIRTAFLWFSGGARQYHPLIHCMNHDGFWITTTVVLDVAVAAGYCVIAFHWRKNERSLPPSPPRQALATMRNIFAFCGFCGYLFVPIELRWPAWRLYDAFMLALVFFTWRYALNVKGLRVLYTAVGRSDQLESELIAARDEARQKGTFLNAISHDLRTPLNGLMLHADLAELHVADLGVDPVAAGISQSLGEIKAAARLTADLLDRLLEYARLDGAQDPLHEGDVSLAAVVDGVLATHAHAATAAGLDLSAAVSRNIVLRTDRLKLQRALSNLVGNAVKYTAAGSVRVTADVVADRSGARVIEIHVTDTGVGIAAEHVGRLFDEFFQIENHERDRQKGFGLGLAIARRLARQLGGDLLVASTVGRGSRFSVVLPAGTQAVAADDVFPCSRLPESLTVGVDGPQAVPAG